MYKYNNVGNRITELYILQLNYSFINMFLYLLSSNTFTHFNHVR
jgi:hypothetical protein